MCDLCKTVDAFDTGECVEYLTRANVDNLGQVQQRCHSGGNIHVVVKDRLLPDTTWPTFDRVRARVTLTSEHFGHDCVVRVNGLYGDDKRTNNNLE